MLQYFRNQIIKNVVYGVGTLFNNIYIGRYDSSGNEVNRIKVPFAYGPKQKFIVRQEQSDSELIHDVAMVLPRMAFELNSMNYDASRKKMTMQQHVTYSTVTGTYDYSYEPVPYNLNFTLYVLAKNTEDGLQILEQIVPYFGPDFTITLKTVANDTSIDVPISIGSVNIEENYEGNFEDRKLFTASIQFVAKANLYGPVKSGKVILTTNTDFINFDRIFSPTGATMATVTVGVTGGATAGSFGPTGTYYTRIVEY